MNIKNDPTVSKCMDYASAWGYSQLTVMNIFALRSTDPKGLLKVDDPVGPENEYWIKNLLSSEKYDKVVLAWGNHAKLNNQHDNIINLLEQIGVVPYCLEKSNKTGMPKHPLYLKKSLVPVEYING